MDEEHTDRERATLFLYAMDIGDPPIPWVLKLGSTDKAQVRMLAIIAGWSDERASQALDECVLEGMADQIRPSTKLKKGELKNGRTEEDAE